MLSALFRLKIVILRRKIHITYSSGGEERWNTDNQFYHTDAITNEALPILSAFIDDLWRAVSDQPAGSVRPHIEREGLLNGLRTLLDSSLNAAWPLFLLAYGRTCCFLLTEADFPQSGPISWPASQGGLERGSLLGPQRGWPDVSPTHACYHWAWIIKGLCSNLCISPTLSTTLAAFPGQFDWRSSQVQ